MSISNEWLLDQRHYATTSTATLPYYSEESCKISEVYVRCSRRALYEITREEEDELRSNYRSIMKRSTWKEELLAVGQMLINEQIDGSNFNKARYHQKTEIRQSNYYKGVKNQMDKNTCDVTFQDVGHKEEMLNEQTNDTWVSQRPTTVLQEQTYGDHTSVKKTEKPVNRETDDPINTSMVDGKISSCKFYIPLLLELKYRGKTQRFFNHTTSVIFVGRKDGCNVTLQQKKPPWRCSRLHAVVFLLLNGTVIVADVGSYHGVKVSWCSNAEKRNLCSVPQHRRLLMFDGLESANLLLGGERMALSLFTSCANMLELEEQKKREAGPWGCIRNFMSSFRQDCCQRGKSNDFSDYFRVQLKPT